jgi:cobalt-zinc-cadmium efflux system membrane fusion protein
VPKQAVQTYETEYVVFVKKSAMLYEPRRVHVGHQFGPLWEVTSGLTAGEQVVTTGSFLFKTELDRGAIGAGCCEAPSGKETP